MKKALLTKLMLLLCALIAGSSSAWAVSKTYKHVLASGELNGISDGQTSKSLTDANGNIASPGVTWSVTPTWKTSAPANGGSVDGTKGQQYGTANNPATSLVFSTTYNFGTITSVKVNASTANSATATIAVQVGTTAFKINTNETVSLTNSAAEYDFTGSATGNITITLSQPSTSKALYVKSLEVTFDDGTEAKVATPTISGQTPFYPSTEVTIACSTDGASIQYSLDDGASWTNYSDPFTLTETKTVKAKATKSGSTDSEVASKAFTKGTAKSVTEALTDINGLADNGTINDQFVEGIVSTAGTSVNSGKITYFISVDGSKSDELQVYSGKGLNNANFSAVTDIALGDKVTVFGQLKKFKSGDNITPEINSGNYLVDFVAVPRFSVAAGAVASGTGVELTTPQAGFTIYYTTNGTDPKTSGTEYTAAITINATTTIKAYAKKGTISSNVVTAEYTVATPAATPTFSPAAGAYNTAQNVVLSTTTDGAEIYYTTNGTEPTTSSTKYTTAIAVNKNTTIKAIAVKDGMANSAVAEAKYTFYAAIPFAFDGNGTEAGAIMGLTANSLGNYDYSPKLKFDATDDYLILQINDAAGKLYYDIKGNSFSGTFKVQTSADGETYTDLKEYTSLTSSVVHESFDLASTVKFIKWIYTNKTGGNVGIGKIGIDCEAAYLPTAGYATYTTPNNVDFTGTGVTAYKVSAIGADNVTLEEVTKAPAGTPLVLQATAGNYALNIVASAAEVTGNQLQISTGNATTDDDNTVYALASKGNPAVVGFYQVKAGTKVPAGKCYLSIAVTNPAPEFLDFNFSGETTEIAGVRSKMEDVSGKVYNLAGQRVAQPTKGLYIVNGKKVVIK